MISQVRARSRTPTGGGDRVGAVDILINNAGISIPARAEDEALTDFRYVMDVNLLGAFRLTQLVGRRMIQRHGGSVVNVASILGLVARRRTGKRPIAPQKAASSA